jgi:putative sigma-54 modulation protein
VQINISARHGHLSAETQDKIRDKLEKLRRLYDRISAIAATVDLENPESRRVELRVSVERNDDFVSSESAASVMAALDGATHKIEQQLRKHKDKRRDRRSQGLGRVELPEDQQVDQQVDQQIDQQ